MLQSIHLTDGQLMWHDWNWIKKLSFFLSIFFFPHSIRGLKAHWAPIIVILWGTEYT